VHRGPESFEARYGTEQELLAQTPEGCFAAVLTSTRGWVARAAGAVTLYRLPILL